MQTTPSVALLLRRATPRAAAPLARRAAPATALLLLGRRAAPAAVLPPDLVTALILRWAATAALVELAGDLWLEAIGSEAGLPAVRLDVRGTTSSPTSRRGETIDVTHLTFAIYARSDADARAVRRAIRAAYRPAGRPDLPFADGRLTLLRPASGDSAMAKIPQEGGRYYQYDDDWVAVVVRSELS